LFFYNFLFFLIMETITIEGKVREGVGKKANKDLRGDGMVPAIMYGGAENVSFSAPTAAFRKLVYTPDFKVAIIELNGKTYRAFIKDLQFHPVSDALLHVDFVELVEGKEVKVEIPLRLVGNSVGVRAGGKLMQKVRKILVKTPVSALVDHLNLDISNMDLGKSLRMRDIVLPEGVTLLGAPATPVATIEIPRALRSAQAAEAKSAAGAKKKK
jgi:large subunit ribosomal protein L25